MSCPIGQKLREEIDFLETGCFWPRAVPWRLTGGLAQKLLVQSWTGLLKFIKVLSFHQKLFNFLIRTDTQTDTQADKQTDTQPQPLMGEIFSCPF
jgi:hypothetical protein